MTIQAIETRYSGHRFRSRREARWAVFLNTLGIPWEYEPQGYIVNGIPYLPDFLIHPNTERAFWLEIKGTVPDLNEMAKAQGLADGTGLTTYIYWARPEPGPDLSHLTSNDYMDWARPNDGHSWNDCDGWIEARLESQPPLWQIGLTPTAYRFNPNFPTRKSNFWWWADCPHCGYIIMKLHGQVGWCPSWDSRTETKILKADELYPQFVHRSPRLLAAYAAALSARFEHGESG